MTQEPVSCLGPERGPRDGDTAGGQVLAELFGGKAHAQWRALYAGAFDWGGDIGRDVIVD
jgi:hypothetical protein